MLSVEPVIPGIAAIAPELIAVRRRIHANPELAFQETATSDLVAGLLAEWGYEVHRGLGKTGVVGVLRQGDGARRIGLRADMDALPIEEATGLPYASAVPKTMHACGHDGHTAMLLCAARYLAESRQFSGTLNVIFQPAEEGEGGALAMIEEGLFEQFPCDAVFGLHNMPGFKAGDMSFCPGPGMASSDRVTITVRGHGGHGAMPHLARDPMPAVASIMLGLNSIVAREVDAQKPAVVSVGSVQAGDTHNVIPQTAQMKLSVRALDAGVRKLLQERITALDSRAGGGVRLRSGHRLRARLSGADQPRGADRLRHRCREEDARRAARRRGGRAAHGQRRLRVHARSLPGQLCVDRQRHRQQGRLHGPQPGLRLQRRHPRDRRKLLGAPR